MIGKFTETREMEHIKKHLMHGRLIFIFTGTSFGILFYNFNVEKGISKVFNILNNMEMKSEEFTYFKLVSSIKNTINNDKYHYLLYYGDLDINDSIYDFMKEFYNPSEELPLAVATVMVDSENIRSDISYPCNIKGEVLEYLNEFLTKLISRHLMENLLMKELGCYSIFSIWLSRKESLFEIEFRSRYYESIDMDDELKNSLGTIINALNLEMSRLGIAI